MGKTILFSAFLCICGCVSHDFTSPRDLPPSGNEETPGWDSPEDPSAVPPVYHFAVLDYMDGYDWRKDPDYGMAQCRLIMTEETEPLDSLDVGYDFCVSSDSDMMRWSAGNLYTDFSTESSTLVKKNGETVFSYPSREMICGLREDASGNVHTLGMPREGDGWSYRINGVEIHSSGKGHILGGLHDDHGVLTFAVVESEFGHFGADKEYFLFVDGVRVRINTEDCGNVTDIRLCRGMPYVLSHRTGENSPVLSFGTEQLNMEVPDGARAEASALVNAGDDIYVAGRIFQVDGSIADVVWKDGTVLWQFPSEYSIVTVWPGEKSCLAVGCGRDFPSSVTIFRDGLPAGQFDGYVFTDPSLADFSRGRTCVCLMPAFPDRKPAVYIDGTLYELDVHGYVAALGVL